MKYTGAVKAGKLANGLELGKGSIVHIIESKTSGSWGYSLCGQAPSISWSERDIKTSTCSKCIKKLRQEVNMKHILGEVDKINED